MKNTHAHVNTEIQLGCRSFFVVSVIILPQLDDMAVRYVVCRKNDNSNRRKSNGLFVRVRYIVCRKTDRNNRHHNNVLLVCRTHAYVHLLALTVYLCLQVKGMVVRCPQLLLSDVRNVVVPSLQYMLRSTSDHDELAKRLFRDPSLLVVSVLVYVRMVLTVLLLVVMSKIYSLPEKCI